jgi:hypothetical protein
MYRDTVFLFHLLMVPGAFAASLLFAVGVLELCPDELALRDHACALRYDGSMSLPNARVGDCPELCHRMHLLVVCVLQPSCAVASCH